MIESINWYPGHMKKTRDLIRDSLKLVDVAVEVIDARIPVSSRNPIIDELIAGKKRIIVMNKCDLASDAETRAWSDYFKQQGAETSEMNSMTGEGLNRLLKLLSSIEQKNNEGRERHRTLKIMIVGVPNVGKSSLINRLTGKKSAQTGDRPGVTKGKQWLTLANGMQLLDTPGILWPKFEDPRVGLYLAFCGSIKDEILDIESLALELITVLINEYPEMLVSRYKIDGISDTPLETMEAIALKRGFILPGKNINYERTASTVLDEFRSAAVGRITLEPFSRYRADSVSTQSAQEQNEAENGK